MKCVPGEDFCVRFRRIADIICIRNPKNHGFFCIFIFVEVQCPYAAERLFEKTGDVFYADADSEPIRTALQMHRKLKNGSGRNRMNAVCF